MYKIGLKRSSNLIIMDNVLYSQCLHVLRKISGSKLETHALATGKEVHPLAKANTYLLGLLKMPEHKKLVQH